VSEGNEEPVFVKSPEQREALQEVIQMLRDGQAGPMGAHMLVVTARGRKTGTPYSTPIGFMRQGDDALAVNRGGRANWYRNARVTPEVELFIDGRDVTATCRHLDSEAEIAAAFEHYRQNAQGFERLFGVAPDASEQALLEARDAYCYVRFSDFVPR